MPKWFYLNSQHSSDEAWLQLFRSQAKNNSSELWTPTSH